MTISTPTSTWPDLAIPPGETLEEELDFREIPVDQFAKAVGLTTRKLRELFAGRRPITAELALALEAELGIDARTWMNLQSDYELTLAYNKRKTAALPR